MENHENSPNQPVLVGTTGNFYQRAIAGTANNEVGNGEIDGDLTAPQRQKSHVDNESKYFKNAHWSPDGTTLLTSSADNTLRSFVLPVDLLSSESSPHALTPYVSHCSPEPVYATAFHPSFSLQEPASCLVLASVRALPLRLISPFAPGILASYPLVSPTTEAYITPHSLLFGTKEANHFFAGSDCCLSVFDINRNGEGPISLMHTTPSRRHHTAENGGMKGIVSTMSMSGGGLLAAGTFSRWVGLYDGYGRGDTVGVFQIAGENEKEDGTDGNGITQVLWSACDRYLCTIERASDGVAIWDIRGTGKKLAWLRGRKARTQQRLGVDLMGVGVWAGGTDGAVRLWEGLGQTEGVHDPKLEFWAHNDAVTSTTLHRTGSVLGTCSGQRHLETHTTDASNGAYSDTDSSETPSRSSQKSQSSLSSEVETSPAHAFDNSMKVWAL